MSAELPPEAEEVRLSLEDESILIVRPGRHSVGLAIREPYNKRSAELVLSPDQAKGLVSVCRKISERLLLGDRSRQQALCYSTVRGFATIHSSLGGAEMTITLCEGKDPRPGENRGWACSVLSWEEFGKFVDAFGLPAARG